MGKPVIVTPSVHQIKSLINISKAENKFMGQVGMLENIKVYELENGELEIELQDTTVLTINNYASREYETFLEHEAKCDRCRLGDCSDMSAPKTKKLFTTFTGQVPSEFTLNFQGQEYTGLSNKSRRLNKEWIG